MKTQTYDTSFGFDTFQGYQNYTEMYYNIGIHRSFVDAFIINLVPLFFATFLLFSLVMTVRVDEKQ